jgi:signal transduction histidine kinase
MLKLAVSSEDPEVFQLCREVLTHGLGNEWSLSVGAGQWAGSDLMIWDFSPEIPIPQSIHADPHRCLFLVSRKDLEAFQARCPCASAGILLKPVGKSTLSAFLEQRMASRNGSGSGDGQIGHLRADRDLILESLILASVKLQEYDQDRTRFLTRAVHDFRAPLTAIAGYCGLMLEGALGSVNADQKEILQRIQHSTKRLSRMANAMFQLGVSRHSEARPMFSAGDLRDAIERSLQELSPVCEDKDLSVLVDLTPPPEALYFDAGQMEQLFMNLLDNGFRFTPRGGSVEIKGYPYFWQRRCGNTAGFASQERRQAAAAAPNSYRVDVADSGPGIPPEHLDRIFEEYTSYSGGQDRSGGGLGLAICRMIADRHNGRIWATTTARGALFSFVLPFRRVANQNRPKADSAAANRE